MSATTPCPRCASPNEDGSRFCTNCGASLSVQIPCPACNSLNPVGNRFCMQCGSGLATAGWSGAATGGVVDGIWERGPDELVRRVEPEDARRFLGNRVVRVPPGTVGVVVVDGVVDRILPPGERTTLSVFERVADFFMRRTDRTAFFLIDQRPIPVPFIVHTRPTATGHVTRTQVLVSFYAPRGDRQGLGTFLANVVGSRAGYGAADLHALLRPDVVRISQETLERLAGEGEELPHAEAEARIRRALSELVSQRYGLAVEVTVAPLTSVRSLAFHLGADAPAGESATRLFTADGEEIELDLIVRVQGQHEDFAPTRITPALEGAAATHLRATTFAQLASPGGFDAAEQALRTAVVEALETYGLQLVALSLVDARSKKGSWLLSARAEMEKARVDLQLDREWLSVKEAGLDLEALSLAQILRGEKLRREAALERRATELELGRKEAGLARDDAYARDEAQLADRQRREALAATEAELRIGGAQRDHATHETLAALSREAALRARGERREDQREERTYAQESERAAFEHQQALAKERRQAEAEAARDAMALEAERRRVQLELTAEEDRVQLDKLAKMAELDAQIASAEHARELEKRAQLAGLAPDAMIAVQAAELARSEGGGAAWAQVLAEKHRAESERAHAEALREADRAHQATLAQTYAHAMDAMGKVASSRAEAPVSVGAGAPIVTVAQGASAEATRHPCKHCGAAMREGARYCGACGKDQA